MTLDGKTYWLIGASDGLGAALAKELDRLGVTLILSARNAEKLRALAEALKDATVLPLDVTETQSVKEATHAIGQIDGIVYLAGAYEPMNAKAMNAEIAIQMIDVNMNGAIRAVGQVLPQFLVQNHGHIVLIGSLSAFRGLPGAIGYGASKAGLLSFAESLAVDLRDTKIKVQIINPGFIKSRLTDKNSFAMPQIMSADFAAKKVIKAMRSRRFNTAFPRPFSWLFLGMRVLPMGVVKRLFR